MPKSPMPLSPRVMVPPPLPLEAPPGGDDAGQHQGQADDEESVFRIRHDRGLPRCADRCAALAAYSATGVVGSGRAGSLSLLRSRKTEFLHYPLATPERENAFFEA